MAMRAGASRVQASREKKGTKTPPKDIERIRKGPDAPGWSADDRALLRATDELRADAFVTDATWAELSRRWSTQQLMDLVFTVGQYNLVSMALNTFGVQPEPGLPRLPAR